jgi:cytochrome c biogenesis protein CcdA
MKGYLFLIFLLFLINPVLVGASNKTTVYFFYSKPCPFCTTEIAFLDQLESKYSDLEIKRFDVAEENNTELFIKMCEAYETVLRELPMTFIGEILFIGYDNDKTSGKVIETTIINCIENGCINPIEKIEMRTSGGEKEISLVQIITLAVVDAINPCELAILVFLITAILTRFPEKKRKALESGLVLSVAIFIVYFFLGLLIISGFKFVANFLRINESWIYQALAIISIIFGLLNIKDSIWYGGGGFVMEVPMSWRPRLKKIIEGTNSVGMAFIVGLIASFFLTPCTGGPYFVAVGILSRVDLIKATPYLFLYLCIFISPMIFITLFFYFGFMVVEDISGWRKKNIKKFHLAAGLLLCAFGVVMLLGSL